MISSSFEQQEQLHVLVLLGGPMVVFSGGVWLATRAPYTPSEFAFIPAFGGLMLSLGALMTYLVLVVQRIEAEASVVRKIGSIQAHQSLRLRLKRLTFVFFLFVGSWIAHLFAGPAGHVLFHVVMIVLGIVSVTLSAHTHSRPSSTRLL